MNSIKKMTGSLRVLFLLVFLAPLMLLSSCKPAIYTIQFPEAGKTYIDNEIVDFVINYTTTVSRADIYLNGAVVGSEFVYGPTSAKANIANLKKYLKQGVNTLSVDPLGLGPTVKFIVDNAGPDIVVTLGQTRNSSSLLDLEGIIRDVSGISNLTLTLVKVNSVNKKTGIVSRTNLATYTLPFDASGKFKKTGLNISSVPTIYSFSATDIYGHTTVREFLADSNENSVMSISNAVRVAVGDTFVSSLRPLVASGLYKSLMKAPIDIRNVCWNDLNIDKAASQNPTGGFCAAGNDGATFNSGLNPVNASLAGIPMVINVKRVNMMKSGDINAKGDPSLGSTVLLNSFKLQAGDYIKINMTITEMLVSISLSLKILIINLSIDPMTLTIGKTIVDTGAIASAVDKKVHVELADSNFGLQDISVSQASIGGINITGIVDVLMPLLEGIIASMLPSILNPILNDELQKIVIGACMYPIDDMGPSGVTCNAPTSTAKFNWMVNVETLKTDNLLGVNSPYDLVLGLETAFNLLKADPFVRTSVGPVYVEDPVDTDNIFNSLGETGTNLTVAVSSNALNQAFAAMYSSGYTHLTLYNGKVNYGANPNKPVGVDGETRVRLYPDSSPIFTLNPVGGGIGGASAAQISYESATLYLDKNVGGTWQPQLQLGVDFKIAASIAKEGNGVKLGVAGSPVFNLNTMINNTAFPVTQSMLQMLLDVVTQNFLPTLTDKFSILDLGQIADTTINGKQALYQTDTDTKTQTLTFVPDPDGAGPEVAGYDCPIVSSTGTADGKLDYVCDTLNFVVKTSTVSSTGEKGTNLFFQMEARDQNIPATIAIPRFDLDEDGVLDYKDNCSVPILMQVAAVSLEGGLVPANVDADGNPVGTFQARVAKLINLWVAGERGATITGDAGSYTSTPTSKGTGTATASAPSATDKTWWNTMRKGDSAIDPASSTLAAPWIKMIYANPKQKNTDGDRFGELCEDDNDRDGIYSGNGIPEDTCPAVKDATNSPGACTIDQADFVMFKHSGGLCLTHLGYSGATDPGGNGGTFAVGNAQGAGQQLQFETCDVNKANQHFYVDISAADSDPGQTIPPVSCGTGCQIKPRIVHIYTNQDKQTEPGFYDLINMHYLATTVANTAATANGCNSTSWANDGLIATTMCGYDNSWREWVLELATPGYSGGVSKDYPFMIESFRFRSTTAGVKRACITPAANPPTALSTAATLHVNAAASPLDTSCIQFPGAPPIADPNKANRDKSQFQILLGPQQAKWSGSFSVD